MAKQDECAFPRCRSRDIELKYLGRQLCKKHWVEVSEMDDNDEIARKLKLPLTSAGQLAAILWRGEQ